jgi:hypothetical protein
MLDILLYSWVLAASFPIIPPSTQCMWHLGSIGVPQMVNGHTSKAERNRRLQYSAYSTRNLSIDIVDNRLSVGRKITLSLVHCAVVVKLKIGTDNFELLIKEIWWCCWSLVVGFKFVTNESSIRWLYYFCLKGTQGWDFFWLRFWNLYYFFISYVKILRFYKKFFLIRPILGKIRFFRLVWD